MEIEKTVIKSGNSSAVILPKSWQGSQVIIKQIKKPINISSDILNILKNYLPKINSIYLVGSYARNNQEKESDIDVVVFTNNINKIIKSSPYEIIMISQQSILGLSPIEKLTISSMLSGAKSIIGEYSLKEYQKKLKLTNSEKLEAYKRIKLSIDKIKKIIDLSKSNDYVTGISYSIILVLRALDTLKNNKPTLTKKELTSLGEIYESYKKTKKDIKSKDKIPYSKAIKIYHNLLEQWERGKKLRNQ